MLDSNEEQSTDEDTNNEEINELLEGLRFANFIIVVTNDVFPKIISTNKQCLPIKYHTYEIMRVDDYRNSIINYLK